MNSADKQNLMNALYDTIRSDVNFEKIDAILKMGIDPSEIYDNKDKGYNGNLLHAHASVHHTSYGEADQRVIYLFVRYGVDINARNASGQTPLHVALSRTDKTEACYACISQLIKSGADVDLKNENGDRPLHMAMKADDWQAYHLLISGNADPSLKDKKGNDATKLWRMLATDRVSSTTVELPLNYRLTEIFNFSTGTYTCISQNLVTKAEAVNVQPLAALSGSDIVENALVALHREGGHADYTVGTLRKQGLKR